MFPIKSIESVDLLDERCKFVIAYVNALYTIVIQEYLKCKITDTSVQPFGRPINVYDKSIVCLEIASGRIAVGDIMAAATNDSLEPYKYSRIDSIEVNRLPQSEIVTKSPVQFGAKVSFRASEKYDYFILNDDAI